MEKILDEKNKKRNAQIKQQQQQSAESRKIAVQKSKKLSRQRYFDRKALEQEVYNSTPMNYTPNTYPYAGTADTGKRQLIRADKMGAKELRGSRQALTKPGEDFLMCAFAPTDFANMSLDGIPDDYRGLSLVKQHRSVGAGVMAANLDTYIILAPTPGFAYWQATVAAGTPILASTVFNGVPFSDFTNLFGSVGSAADTVTKFRYISNHLEIIPTVNQMNWTGNIQAWKFPLALTMRTASTTAVTTFNLRSLTGLQALNATNANQYTAPFNLGCYTAAYSSNCEFNYNDVIENQVNVPNTLDPDSDFGTFATNGTVSCFPGLDNGFNSVVIKVSGVGANTLDSYIIKTWACVEYSVLAGTSIYEYQTISPTDKVAMDLYRSIILSLPVGVSFAENASFWSRVLDIIKTVSGGLVELPGPYGLLARGTNLAATGLMHFTDNS
jgi:hypothetical protein